MEDTKIKKLENLLEDLQDWEKFPTNIAGIRIVKIPGKKDNPGRLGIEMNPVDENGKPIKKSGVIVLTNQELFDKYYELFSNDKVQELMQQIELIRIEQEKITNNTEEVFEL